MENQKKTAQGNKKWIWLAAVLVIVIAAMVTVYLVTRPQTDANLKALSVTVESVEGQSAKINLQTNAEFLRGALEEIKLISGDESEYGLFVKTVNGYTVDDSKQEWWCFTKGGETLMTGVDSTPIADGDAFEITLKTGY